MSVLPVSAPVIVDGCMDTISWDEKGRAMTEMIEMSTRLRPESTLQACVPRAKLANDGSLAFFAVF